MKKAKRGLLIFILVMGIIGVVISILSPFFNAPVESGANATTTKKITTENTTTENTTTENITATLETTQPTNPSQVPKKNIIVYFPGWAAASDDYPNQHATVVSQIPWDKITCINHAFLGIGSDMKIKFLDKQADITSVFEHSENDGLKGHFGEYKFYKQKYKDVKVLVSVGGWTDSQMFTPMASKPETRKIFISSVIDFLNEYSFLDGIDIDWEYPGVTSDNGTNGDPQNDWKNYNSLAKELRQALDDAFGTTNTRKSLTMCAPAPPYLVQEGNNIYTDIKTLSTYMDSINIMTYDYEGIWSDTTGHQSPLKTINTNAHSIEKTVDFFLTKVSPEKITIGSPFYGCGWGGVFVEEGKSPIGAPAGQKGISKEIPSFDGGNNLPYFMLRKMEKDKNYIAGYDELAEAAWLYNPTKGTLYSYDSERSLQAKLDYINKKNIGGIIVWEISNDSMTDGFPMTSLIYNSFTQN